MKKLFNRITRIVSLAFSTLSSPSDANQPKQAPTHELMNKEELHEFGIRLVLENDLLKNGYEILSLSSGLDEMPQIVAKKDGELAFIAVITTCYPEQAQLSKRIASKLISFAKNKNGQAYFAPLILINADEKSRKEICCPVREGIFCVGYRGLKILMNVDQVKVMDPLDWNRKLTKHELEDIRNGKNELFKQFK